MDEGVLELPLIFVWDMFELREQVPPDVTICNDDDVDNDDDEVGDADNDYDDDND